jgi:hypothetical protein
LHGSRHDSFSDAIFSRGSVKAWLLTNPYRIKSIVNAYLLAFFETYVRGIPAPLLAQSPPPFREVEALTATEN